MRNRLLILFFFAALFSPQASQAQTLFLKADSLTVPCHDADTFLVPIRADNFTNLSALQFSLGWNPAHLDYAYVTEVHPTLLDVGFDTTTFINQGKMSFAWTTIGGGQSLPNNTVLFKVAFARLGGPATLVNFTNDPTPILAADGMFNTRVVVTTSGLITPIDNAPPTVTCPATVTMEVFGPTQVPNIAPMPLDDCSIENIGWSTTGATSGSFPNDPDASNAVFNIGQSTVTYQVQDAGGNTASCSFLINLTLAPSDSLTLIASNNGGSCGQTITINVSVLNFDSISGLQFSLGWNPALLEFDTVTNAHPSLFLDPTNFGFQPDSGRAGFAWTSQFQAGQTLSNGSILFSLTFKVVGTSNANANIVFGNLPTPMLASTGFPPQGIGFLTVNGLVTISDAQPPTIQCPANQFVQTAPGVLNATFNNLAPLAMSDNCSPTVGLTYQQTGSTTGSGSGPANGLYNAGTTVVTYTAADLSGNTATCSFTVTVDAGTPLTIILDTVEVDCQAANAQIAVNLTVRDFVNIAGLQFDVTWDSSIIDFDTVANIRPGLGLNPGMFFGFTSAQTGNTLKFFGTNINGWPTVPQDSTIFTIYFTVKDPNGLSNINFTGTISAASIQGGIPVFIPVVTINGFFKSADFTPPILMCAPIVVPADSGACSATLLVALPPATDVCSGVQSVTANAPHNLPFTFPPGATMVAFTAVDSAGNSATCSTTVTVQGGNGLPQLSSCPPNVTVGITSSGCTKSVTWTAPTAVNPCNGSALTVTSSAPSGSLFPLGDSTVTFTTFNTMGDTVSCSFSITVVDSLAPVFINCQDPPAVQADSTCTALAQIDPIMAGDNCDQSIMPVPDIDVSLPFQVGSSQVTYTATDAAGNSKTCVITVTVFDVNPPVFDNCPTDVTVYSAADSCGVMVIWAPIVVNDDCSALVNLDPPNYSGEFFPVDVHTVTYTASEGSGTNTASCQFTVTVLDTLAPVFIICPTLNPIFLPANKCDTLLTLPIPLVTDGCGIDNLTESLPSPAFLVTGTHVAEYVASDPSGNTSTCSFTITVLDVVPPVLAPCPKDTVILNADPCGMSIHWDLPNATDNCLLDSIYSIPASDSLITSNVTTVVVYAVDASGNEDTCSFTITLQVVIEPPGFVNFPTDTVVNGCPQPVTWTLPISNGKSCNPDTVTFFPDLMPGDTFPIGDTTITYYLIDLVTGDTLEQQAFTITVQDIEPPQYDSCITQPVVVHVAGVFISNPNNFITSIDTVTGCTGVELTFNLLSATDNCGTADVEQTAGPLTGGFFAGDSVYTLVYTATDAVGNTSPCSVNITVLGLQPLNVVVDPPVACPGELVSLIADPIPMAIYNWTGPPTSLIDLNKDNIGEVFASQGNAGTYTVSASLNGCTTPPATAVLELYAVQAIADTIIVTMGGGLDTFSVIANDVIFPAGSSIIVDTCGGVPDGVNYLGNGIFTYEVTGQFRPFSFFYCLCLDTMLCPNVCDTAALVTVRLDVADCSFIPNVITPNKDGVNDYFRIPCLDTDQFRDNSIVIYNQWGDKVFEAAPYTNMWAGTLNGEDGKDLPDGVYYYVFRAGSTQPMRKGFVQIHR
ncbi:MAG: HYR domain-containing protein [Saprospiraceae bacterium]